MMVARSRATRAAGAARRGLAGRRRRCHPPSAAADSAPGGGEAKGKDKADTGAAVQDDAEAEAVPEGLDPAVFNSSEAVAARARVLELTRAGPETVSTELPPKWVYPLWMDRLPAYFGRMGVHNGVLIYFTGALWAETQGAEYEGVRAQWLFWLSVMLYVVYRLRLWRARRAARKAQRVAEAEGAGEAVDEGPEIGTKAWKYAWRHKLRDAWVDLCLTQQMLLPAGMAGQVTMLWVLPIVWIARWLAATELPFRLLKLMRGAMANVLMFVCAPAALASMLYAGASSMLQVAIQVPKDPMKALMLAPASLLITYVVNVAPAALLFKAIGAQWRRMRAWQIWMGELKEAKEEAAILSGAQQPTKAPPFEKYIWIALFIGAVAFSMAFPKKWFSDLPITGIFMLQWWNSARRSGGGDGIFDAAMDVMINKGVSKEESEAGEKEKKRQAAIEGTAPVADTKAPPAGA